jgi:DNA-binding MarR family transcriptional regulator
MDVEKFSKRMIELMPQCIRGFSRHEHNYLSRGKITMPQFWVLEYLSRGNGQLMGEIADFLGVSRPATTGLIDRLIGQELVRREDIPDDRRTVKINITAKGRQIVQSIWDQKRRTLVKVFSQLSAKDREEYIRIFEQVVGIVCQPPTDEKKAGN